MNVRTYFLLAAAIVATSPVVAQEQFLMRQQLGTWYIKESRVYGEHAVANYHFKSSPRGKWKRWKIVALPTTPDVFLYNETTRKYDGRWIGDGYYQALASNRPRYRLSDILETDFLDPVFMPSIPGARDGESMMEPPNPYFEPAYILEFPAPPPDMPATQPFRLEVNPETPQALRVWRD